MQAKLLRFFSLATATALSCAGCATRKQAVTVPPAPPAEPAVAAVPQPSPEGPPPKSEWRASASGMQEETFKPAFAIDGKTDTRWSSPSSDPQWIKVDLGRPVTITGLTILWETAFSSKYHVETSADNKEWKTVYRNETGDGSTDYFFFAPTLARYVRVTCTERGTSWGHSMWEIDIKGPGEQPIATAPTAEGSNALNLIDGNRETAWTAGIPPPHTVEIDLSTNKAFGGLRIDWGESYGTEVDMLVSADRETWTKVSDVRDGSGRFDVMMHPKQDARYIRLDIGASADNKPVELREISLRGPDEVVSPLALYQLAAEKAKPGLYPQTLLKKQIYWTLVGLPNDREESLLDEYGVFEPRNGSCTLTPFVWLDGQLLSALDASTISQTLEGGYMPLPSVTCAFEGLSLTVQAMAYGTVEDSVSWVRYRLSNPSDAARTGTLYLAVRPLQINPPWQYGGLSPISSIQTDAVPEGRAIRVNGEPLYIALNRMSGFGAAPFDRGDIVDHLAKGILPAAKALSNGTEQISAAMAYDFDIAPGGRMDVVVASPLHNDTGRIRTFSETPGSGAPLAPGEAFDVQWAEARRFWKAHLDKVPILLPQPEAVHMMRSQVAYILINRDGVAIQPGSRNYKRCWIRDGSLTSAAMLKLGMFEEVREYLEWYSKQVQTNGWVPPILNNDGSINKGFGWDNEYDSQGEYIFALMEYYRFTRDRAFLEEHFDEIERAMKYLVILREQTLQPGYMANEAARERFVGILPKSISHEGYHPPMHSYWDDFWALKGWKDGKQAAEELGREDVAAWAEEQYQALRASLQKSIETVMAFKKIDFIPGCAEKGDPDPTSTAIAVMPCDEMDLLDSRLFQNTFDLYYRDLVARQSPDWIGGFTPYEVRSMLAFVRLGQKDRAKLLLDFILSCRRPLGWNVLAEVVHTVPRLGVYIGDMPHTWVGSGFINSVRGLLAMERRGRLSLLAGAPPEWLAGDGITIENLPTHFGTLNLRAFEADDTLTVQIGGKLSAPDGIELYWPSATAPASVTVDGSEWKDFDDTTCRLPNTAREITAEW